MADDDLYLKVELLERATAIVCAFVSSNATPASAVPELIAATHTALEKIVRPAVTAPAATTRPLPAGLTIENSVTDEHIVSFIDGKPYKMLKRHLTHHGHTPQSYREAYGLPADFPMTAPAYARTRSDLAKTMGLGTIPKVRSVAAKAA